MNENEKMQEVWGLLDGLGDTAEEVAESLRVIGITGIKENSLACPIHNFLANHSIPCSADDYYITVIDPDCGDFEIVTPKPVSNFISRFDNGEFEFLRSDEELADDADGVAALSETAG